MISPRLVLTNNHVLPDAETARFSRMEFNVQNGVDGHPLTTSEFDLQPDVFFRTDTALDFTLAAVAPQSRPNGPARRVRWQASVSTASAPPRADTAGRIHQYHPAPGRRREAGRAAAERAD